jgi:hypothetical protein
MREDHVGGGGVECTRRDYGGGVRRGREGRRTRTGLGRGGWGAPGRIVGGGTRGVEAGSCRTLRPHSTLIRHRPPPLPTPPTSAVPLRLLLHFFRPAFHPPDHLTTLHWTAHLLIPPPRTTIVPHRPRPQRTPSDPFYFPAHASYPPPATPPNPDDVDHPAARPARRPAFRRAWDPVAAPCLIPSTPPLPDRPLPPAFLPPSAHSRSVRDLPIMPPTPGDPFYLARAVLPDPVDIVHPTPAHLVPSSCPLAAHPVPGSRPLWPPSTSSQTCVRFLPHRSPHVRPSSTRS